MAGAVFFEMARSEHLVGSFDVAWLDATLEVELESGGGPDTWAFADRFGLDAATAYEVVADLVDWLNDGARPWTGSATWLPLYTNHFGTIPEAAWGAGVYESTLSVPFDWTVSTALEYLSGFVTNTAPATGYFIRTQQVAPHNWWHGSLRITGGLRLWDPYREDEDAGGHLSRDGGIVDRPRPTTVKRPRLEAILNDAECKRLAQVLGTCTPERRAHVYDDYTDTWTEVRIAGNEHPVRGTKLTAAWRPEVYVVG